MRKRYEYLRSRLPRLHFRFGTALRTALAEGYSARDLRADVLAGMVVGVVALPLSMALAIASGVPPQYGLYTAIVAGGLIAVLGGARTSVSGPTAAFVVLLVPVSTKYGLGGLLLATLMAGCIQILMGAARLGRLIQFIPHPVTTGFTAGIAVVIATLQIPAFAGLEIHGHAETFVERIGGIARAFPTTHWPDLAVGVLTLALLLGWSKMTKKIPAPLAAITIAAVGAWLLHHYQPDFNVATIGSKFSYVVDGQTYPGIPRTPPTPALPWLFPGPGPDGQPLTLSTSLLAELVMPALAIAMLGAIESLLCAVVADGMTGHKHDPDVELIGQGVGNVVVPFFGGFAATGAIARTAANIRSGGRSPVAAVAHALFVLAAMLALAPILSHLPMASLAALLILVAWNMSDARHFVHVLRVAPRSDMLVLLTCFLLTVIFDMVVAVTAGVMLAALLFMRRMAEMTELRLADEDHPHLLAPLPPGVFLYEIAGPLFFGAAEKAVGALGAIAKPNHAVILEMSAVPVMDVTGLVALETAINRLRKTGVLTVLAGVQPQPAKVLANAGWRDEPGHLMICATLPEAEMLVRLVHESSAEPN